MFYLHRSLLMCKDVVDSRRRLYRAARVTPEPPSTHTASSEFNVQRSFPSATASLSTPHSADHSIILFCPMFPILSCPASLRAIFSDFFVPGCPHGSCTSTLTTLAEREPLHLQSTFKHSSRLCYVRPRRPRFHVLQARPHLILWTTGLPLLPSRPSTTVPYALY